MRRSVLGGQHFNCIDSSVSHAFGFTPAMSIAVTCDTPQEVDDIFNRLSPGGNVMMPPDAYPFSQRYAWFSDKFGISWQVRLNS